MRLIILFLVASLFQSAIAESKKLVMYSSRKEHLVKPLFDMYTKKTGVEIEFLTDKDPVLVKRLQTEANSSPADLLITVDAGNLYLAQSRGLLAPVQSEALNSTIPAHLRDPEGHWFGLSIRARPIFFNSEKVKSADLVSYEGLADKKWKGRLCLRTSKKVYNQSLVAMMLSHHSQSKVEKVLKGWVANLAAPVFSSDTQLLKAIEAGQCDVGIANSYYYGRLLKDKKVKSVALFWPNQSGTGAHINISGAALIKSSQRKTEAKKFLEWLATPEAQKVLANSNMEYPANPKVKSSPIVQGFGRFEPDKTNLKQAGALQAQAVLLMDKVGYK